MLCIQHPWLASHVRKPYDHAGTKLFEDANSFYALSKVLGSITPDDRLQKVYLVIDALDECVAGQDQLLQFLADHTVASLRVKRFVSSRNIPEIGRRLNIDRFDSSGGPKVKLSLEVTQNAEHVTCAVEAFIDHKLLAINSLQDEPDTRTRVREAICEKAAGTFLWVALVVKELEMADSFKVGALLDSFRQG